MSGPSIVAAAAWSDSVDQALAYHGRASTRDSPGACARAASTVVARSPVVSSFSGAVEPATAAASVR